MLRKNRDYLVRIALILGLAASISLSLQAQTDASAPQTTSYEIAWSTFDGGGQTSTGSTYALTGTMGQPDAGMTLSGGTYTLAGGFWGIGAQLLGGRLYLPLLRR